LQGKASGQRVRKKKENAARGGKREGEDVIQRKRGEKPASTGKRADATIRKKESTITCTGKKKKGSLQHAEGEKKGRKEEGPPPERGKTFKDLREASPLDSYRGKRLILNGEKKKPHQRGRKEPDWDRLH